MRPIRTLLIANRGEIACRIARTARRLGLRAVGVHTPADRGARHVREIGESVALPGDGPGAGYLDADAIVAAALRVGADAVHPGYGFLSEQPSFVRAVEAAERIFVGPTAETMARLGGKAAARREAARLGIPVLEGTQDGAHDAAAIAAAVRTLRLPAVLKAVHGGGGRGMALIESLDGLQARIEGAMREADKAFGDGALIVERWLPRVRHVEVQIAGDGAGRVIHLFERECTLQRRHQKIVEEAPAAALAPAIRDAMLADACRLAAAVDYRGLGTVEFVVDDDVHHFLEVNPRLQVEHPVTEAVTGLDLVELQLTIAATGRLPLAQEAVRVTGHAVEARVCAEDPATGWLPATGTVRRARFPGAPLRVEAAIDDGDAVSAHYDSMIAKVIAHAPSRDAALDALRDGLRRTTIVGVPTNLPLLDALLELPETRASRFHTRLIDERFGVQAAPDAPPIEAACAVALAWLARTRAVASELGCWTQAAGFTGWRLGTGEARVGSVPVLRLRCGAFDRAVGFARARAGAGGDAADGALHVTLGDEVREATLRALGDGRWLLETDGVAHELGLAADGDAIEIWGALGRHRFDCAPWLAGGASAAAGDGRLAAPMMGKVVAIEAAPGDAVRAGQAVVVLESMKMELRVSAPFDAIVVAVRCAVGDMVERGAALADVQAAQPAEEDAS